MRRHRRLLIGLTCALATFSVAATATAAGPEGFKEMGVTAIASRDTCSTDGTSCDSIFLYAFIGRSRDLSDVFYGGPYRQKVFYEEGHETYDTAGNFVGSSGRFGAVLDSGTVTADGLRSVTLAPTSIPLKSFTCNASTCTTTPDGTVIVEGRWTGAGSTTTHKTKSKIRDDSCVEIYRDEGDSRAAVFAGTADGHALEQTIAQISQGTIVFRFKCR